uniref:Src kinase associated phosphoprotein 1 n=1 Tax=Cyanistes caeruleus TaxID=156563 RepID=A0A8C0VPU9_CYACU
MDPAIPEEIRRLLGEAEDFLAWVLREEPLSAGARRQRDAILGAFQRLKTRYHLEFPSRGEDEHDGWDGSDENPSWNFGPSQISEVPFPAEFQDEGPEEIPQPVQDSGNILKQGYLEKRSREPSFFGSEWHKRWCVLTRRSFLYYASEKSEREKNSQFSGGKEGSDHGKTAIPKGPGRGNPSWIWGFSGCFSFLEFSFPSLEFCSHSAFLAFPFSRIFQPFPFPFPGIFQPFPFPFPGIFQPFPFPFPGIFQPFPFPSISCHFPFPEFSSHSSFPEFWSHFSFPRISCPFPFPGIFRPCASVSFHR